MTKTIIYTINREYGSGGRAIGERLAERLGAPFYDKKLVEHAASQSGISEHLLRDLDEKPTNSFLYSLVVGSFNMGGGAITGSPELSMSDKVFIAESDVIKQAASKGQCVIVGRCADYILRHYPNVVNLFITGDKKDKIRRVQEEYGLSGAKVDDILTKTDKRRASYYNYYSGKKWHELDSYDLCINSSLTGIDGAVNLILAFGELVEAKMQGTEQHS